MKYKVKSRLNHDGKMYEPEQTVELNDKDAGPLVIADVVEPVSYKKKEEVPVTTEGESKNPEETEEQKTTKDKSKGK